MPHDRAVYALIFCLGTRVRFNHLDLNLLVALDALLTERSITRAAERLHLSQSATSNALARLRDYFDDELLVPVGRRMEPTARAERLRESVRDVLVRIDSTIAMQPEFDPATSDRCFRIFVSDYTQMVFVPHVLTLAAREGCTAKFEFLPQVSSPQRNLERGEADLLIIPKGFLSPEHPREVLYTEDFVCVVWRDAALAQGDLTLERYLAAGHVVMQRPGDLGDSFDTWHIQQQGVTRRTVTATFGFTTLPSLVIGTEHVATVQRRLAELLAPALPIALRPSPVPMRQMEQGVQWHKYRAEDPGLVWVRGLLRRAADMMCATES